MAVSTLVVLTATAAPASAGGGAPSKPRIDTVASGLDNPRGLVVTDDLVLVTEAGRGGTGPCIPFPEGGQQCLGATGAITAARHGRQHRIATGLPSLVSANGETVGPADLALTHSGILVTLGLGGDPANRAQLGPAGRLAGQVVTLTSNGPRPFADLAAYEGANNPDRGQPGSMVDTNAYGLTRYGDGGALATDAGGNDLLAIDRRGGISTVAVFGPRIVPNPFGGPDIPMESVPTTVTRGPDGAYYVGELTGFPFHVGAARVWRVVPGRPATVYATGFTNIIDIAFDHHGRLVVLEIARNGLLSMDPTGALIRVGRDGSRTEIASTGLVTPTSVAVADDGSFYVSNKGTMAGTGEVVRIRS